MPLLDTQIAQVDSARMQFIDELNAYVHKLREELRINELLLHSVVKSMSVQTENVAQLDDELHKVREERADHKPLLTRDRKDVMGHVGDAVDRALNDMNSRSNRPTTGPVNRLPNNTMR